jgi:glycerol uptake facilitator protein
MSLFLSEFIGTYILIVFGAGVVAGAVLSETKSNNAGWLAIVFGWAIGVSLGIYASGASGAHINPAVTLGLAFVGEFDWQLVPLYFGAQMLGAFFGAVTVWLFYLPHWRKTQDADAKLAVFCTAPAIRKTPSNLISEIFGAAILLFAILFIGINQFTEGLNPLVVGLLVAAIGLSLGGTTGYAINPARDLGPRLAHFFLPIAGKRDADWKYSWVPIFGPFVGGMLGCVLHQMAFKEKFHWYYAIPIVITFLIIVWAIFEEKKENTDA